MSGSQQDRRFMAAALRLSRWNTGLTGTNPSVACLVVLDGIIVGQAVTAPSGRPHAETQALAIAGEKARGATAYVTLEPCSHHGKTPPCVDALIAYGVARVVVCLVDPDERVSGRGLDILRAAGIAVETGVLEQDGERALQSYLMRQRSKRPHVTLKLAVSADGMLGRRDEGQVRITGAVSRAQVQVLRAETDAILVGIGTALADNPELTVRFAGLEDRSPIRIVLDRDLRLPLDGQLVTTARDVPVIVVTGEDELFDSRRGDYPPLSLRDISPTRGEISRDAGDNQKKNEAPPAISPLVGEMSDRTEGGAAASPEVSYQERRAALEAAGVEILHCEPKRLADLLEALATRGISSLLVEGGAAVAQSFLDAHLVDRLLLFTGPDSVGEGGVESPVSRDRLPSGFRLLRQDRFGNDMCDDYERED